MNLQQKFSLDGKLALVTGASKGIGLGMAQALAEAGADVVLVARNADELAGAAATLRETGRKVAIAPYDLKNVSGIGAWYDNEIVKKIGAPDILINNAGMTKRAFAQELELKDWDEIITVNLTAAFALAQAFGKERIASGKQGKIVNTASLMTAASRPGTSAYTASKGGIGQLTKALAVDWAGKGIWVNAVAPGYIATPLTKPLQDDKDFDAWVKKRCPLGRWGKPEDMAWPVVFLSSPASDFITGEVLYVDGGWMATF
jgi:NAD(P)-dependent dehydrogenase (short-subunit alcohol dehydrogenase family)